MKTSWLNGSKRFLSALLIAAALMLCWMPLGEGTAQAATDKGQQFADAAKLFAKTDTDFAQDMYGYLDSNYSEYGTNTADNNQFYARGA